jgi:hypothetical protein
MLLEDKRHLLDIHAQQQVFDQYDYEEHLSMKKYIEFIFEKNLKNNTCSSTLAVVGFWIAF